MRGHVREHITKAGKKTYRVVYDVGRDENGKRKQKWLTGYTRKGDADRALRSVLKSFDDGTYQEPCDETLYEHSQKWLRAQPNVRETTLAWYEDMLSRFVLPTLGPRKIQSITVDDLNTLYKGLQESGGRGGRPLSLSTIRGVRVTAHKCFKYALRRSKIARNPADLVDPPAFKAKKKITAWTSEELGRFLRETETDRLYPLWLLIAVTGLRRGEALGLGWDSVDLTENVVRVHRSLIASPYKGVLFAEPKSDRSRRSVPIPPEAVRALRRWKAQQGEERLAWGSLWTDSGLAFTRPDGQPLRPDYLSDTFSARVKALGLPTLSIHGLRHTFATLALEAGIAPKVVADILGHSSIQITLDTYSSSIPAMQKEATGRVANLVFGGGMSP